MPQYLTTLN